MTFNDFTVKYLGKRLDFDRVYQFQCVDLAKAYVEEVWGIKSRSVGYSGGAKDIMRSDSMCSDDDVKRIKNTPDGIPPRGAIIIFDSAPANIYGHVGVCVSGDIDTVTILEQNGGAGTGTGQGPDAIRQKTYKYTANTSGVGKVLGWLVPNNGCLTGVNIEPDLSKYPSTYQDAIKNGDVIWLANSLLDRDTEIKHYKQQLGI